MEIGRLEALLFELGRSGSGDDSATGNCSIRSAATARGEGYDLHAGHAARELLREAEHGDYVTVDGVQRTYEGADRRAADNVDGDSHLLHCSDDADV